MNFTPFSYTAWVLKLDWKTGKLLTEAVVDGDSTWLIRDKGDRLYESSNCRLYGVNAPELNSPDPAVREKAQASKAWLKGMIEGKHLYVYCRDLDKYGRPLIILWLDVNDFGDNSKSVNKMLLDGGFGVPFMGELL
jgi:endonuclease YncB( thermonuclease family)